MRGRVSSYDDAAAGAAAGDAVVIAVSATGRRAKDDVVVDERVVEGVKLRALIPFLDHAGPAAARWSVERPVGPAAVKESTTGRLPRVLDDDEFASFVAEFKAAADAVRAKGVVPVVAALPDGLLHACCSPLMCQPPRPDRVVAVVAACAPCDVLVVVEDLAPGGTDATTGVEFARLLVDTARATTLYATAGTVRLAPLLERDKGASVDVDGAFLFSAAWCVGRVNVPVVAVGRSAAPRHVLRRRAKALNLAGFLVVD